MKKRLLCLLLCLSLVLTCLPMGAAAVMTEEDEPVADAVNWTEDATGYTYSYTVYRETVEPTEEDPEPERPLYAKLTWVAFGEKNWYDMTEEERSAALADPIDLALPNTLPYQGQDLPVRIADVAFHQSEYFPALRSLSVPVNVEIFNCTFADSYYGAEGSDALKAVTFAEGSHLKTLGHSCFRRCLGLTGIELPEGLETIGANAFEQTPIRSITLPSTVKRLGCYAFWDCTELASVTLNEGLEDMQYVPNMSGENTGPFPGCTALTEIDIPGTVQNIPYHCFYGCENLRSVTFGEGVQTIGEQAFYGCGLQTLTLPDSMVSLGYRAFENNPNLESVSLGRDLEDLCEGRENYNQDNGNCFTFSDCPMISTLDMSRCEKLKSIPNNIFAGKRLSSVSIPDCVETIGREAFAGQCGEDGPESYYGAGDNLVYNLTSLTLGSGVKVIREGAFADNRSLTGTLILPDSLTVIESDDVFESCGFTDVRWPDNPEFTTATGFSGCSSLAASAVSNLPYSVTTIGERAFAGAGFTELTIPGTVRVIGKEAFSGADLTALTIMDGVTVIEEEAFANCSGLAGKTVELPGSVSALCSGAFSLYDRYTESDVKQPLTVRALNPDLELIAKDEEESYWWFVNGSAYFWYADEAHQTEKGRGNDPFGWLDEVILYAPLKKSDGTDHALKQYAELHDGTWPNYFDGDQMHVVFRELTDVPVYHTVTVPKADGVEITVRQDSAALTLTDAGASFTAAAREGADVVVTARKDGYYDQVITRPAADFRDDWTVTLEEFTAMPVSGRLLVNVTAGGLPMSSFDALSFSLKNGGADVAFTVNYPYLVVTDPDSVGADTELTLAVTPDASLALGGADAATTLRAGTAELALQPWGNVSVSAGSPNDLPCVIALYSDAGDAAATGVTRGGAWVSDPLPAGVYTAAAFQQNGCFGAPGKLTDFAALGLRAGTDYVSQSVRVADGAVAELNLSAPRLDTSRLTSALENGSVYMRSQRAVAGQLFDVRVQYALRSAPAGNLTLQLALPAGVSVQSVCDDNGALSFTGSTVQLRRAQKGSIYLNLRSAAVGPKTVAASLDTGALTLPLGSAVIEVQKLFVDTDAFSGDREGNEAVVTAAPNTEVTLKLEDGSYSARTNAIGVARLAFRLPEDTVYGQNYSFTVTGGGGSAMDSITYWPEDTKVESLTFYQGNSYGIRVIDAHGPPATSYTYLVSGEERHKYFSFEAYLSGNEALKNVRVIVYMQDGSTRTAPLTHQAFGDREDARCYMGELYIDNEGDHVFKPYYIPVAFEVAWDSPVPETNYALLGPSALGRALVRQAEREECYAEIEAQVPDCKPVTEASMRSELIAELRTSLPDAGEAEITALADSVIGELKDAGLDFSGLAIFGYGYRLAKLADPVMTDGELQAHYAEIDADASLSAAEKTAAKQYYKDIYDDGRTYLNALHEFEGYMDQYCDLLTDYFGLPKKIQEYAPTEAGMREFFKDVGVTLGDSPSAGELKNSGYEDMGDGGYFQSAGDGFRAAWPESSGNVRKKNIPPSPEYLINQLVGQQAQADIKTQAGSDSVAPGTILGDQIGVYTAAMEIPLDKAENAAGMQMYHALNPPKGTTLAQKDALIKAAKKQESLLKPDRAFQNGAKAVGVGVTFYNFSQDMDEAGKNFIRINEVDGTLKQLETIDHYYDTHEFTDKEKYPNCAESVKNEIELLKHLKELLDSKQSHLYLNMTVSGAGIVANFTPLGPVGGAVVTGVTTAYDVGSTYKTVTREQAIALASQALRKQRQIRIENCGGTGFRKCKPLSVLLDPSGVVYEAVESNVLEGVTATVVNAADAGAWNAGDYDQVNPQITGPDGAYAWDVPVGTWRVEFEKDGYESARTDDLTVPPPRMNLKTAMVSRAAPEVTGVNAYPEYTELIFSQYMDVTAALRVPDGCTAEWVGQEKVNAESSVSYAKVLRLIPAEKPKVGDSVTVALSGAKNYAGAALPDYRTTAAVTVRPAAMELNYSGQIALLVGETPVPRVSVRVLDENGRPIPGLRVTGSVENPLFAELTEVNAITDTDGLAFFSVEGRLPGLSEASFSVEGASLKTDIPLRVTVDSNRAARPTAALGETVLSEGAPKENYVTVAPGTLLTLDCATEGAQIYYTTNDACPCQDTANRVRYTGPIPVTADAYYRIAAYKEGMEYSERLNIHVSVTGGVLFEDVRDSGKFYYDPVYWAFNARPQITNGVDATHFGPDRGCTRGQVVTFLWRAAGCPEPANAGTAFTDLKEGGFYGKAVAWAVENEITNGMTATTFAPDATCTRGQIVTFLWRFKGKAEPAGTKTGFTDVSESAFYARAVAWAVENGVTNGMTKTTFGPDATCTRGQVVTFLYRATGGN